MKIDRLQELQKQLLADLKNENILPTLYYNKDKQWIPLDPDFHITREIISCIEKAEKASIAHHTPGSTTAWFFIANLNITISLDFEKPPRTNTRKKLRSTIEQIEKNCTNAYKVSHHPLTNLLSKDSFRAKLATEISRYSSDSTSKSETQESSQTKTLATLALDIDFFKQVNDTWGHLYGDQVLKIFGKRLEDTAAKIQSNIEKPLIYLGHPSGEEFLIIISAFASKEKILEWCNNFRSAIYEDVLPTDNEWQWLSQYENLSELTPPPISERSISTSIGVALFTNLSKVESRDDQTSILLDKADTALYRAKAAGRNQVIFYDDILSNCGRVIEQNSSTKIIAIDIGSNVGVTVGQEFKVFHPTFTGKVKFSINDGRTTRTLGVYPRVQAARIVVFNTQPEISFACIEENEHDDSVPIENGSHLEAIPAGSIGHLLPHASRYFPASSNLGSSPHDFIENSAKNGIESFAIVAKFSRDTEYIRKYGTASLNSSLAKLYKICQVKFQSANAIEVLDRASICIVGRQKNYKERMISDFASETATEFPELGIMIGIFNNQDKNKILEEHQLNLDAANSIEFARFSASGDPVSPEVRTNHFSPKLAYTSLRALRESGSYEIGYADFERLIQAGVETASILNLGGLLAGAMGVPRTALKHYLRAIEIDPNDAILKSNYCTVANGLDEIEPGLKILNEAPDKMIDTIYKSHTWGYISYTCMLAKAKNRNLPEFNERRFIEMAPKALSLPDIDTLPNIAHIIKQALASPPPQV